MGFAAFIGVSEGRSSIKASVGSVPDQLAESVEAMTNGRPEAAVSQSLLPVQPRAGQTFFVTLKKQFEGAWVLCLGPKVTEEPFNRQDLEMAESVASHVATIVEKLELLEELEVQATELRELNRRMSSTQETERARVAAYLHDEPLQQITNLIWRHAGVDLPPEVQRDLQHIDEGLRNFTARLQPALLEDLGLVRALEWLGSEAGEASGFKFVFDVEGLGRDQSIDPEIELALYRMAQEALSNCQRHAGASNVWLRLAWDAQHVTLIVEDDGVGMPPSRASAPGKRLGLIGMRERAEQLGGRIQFSARNPKGTCVLVSIPAQDEPTLRLSSNSEVIRHDQSANS